MDISTDAKTRSGDDGFCQPASPQTPFLGRALGSVRREQAQRWLLIAVLAFSDALMISLALVMAWYIRIESGLLAYYSQGPFHAYWEIVIIAVPLLLVTFCINGLYKYDRLMGGTQEYEAVVRACTYGVVVLVFIAFMEHDFLPSRGWLLISWVLSIVLVGTPRISGAESFDGSAAAVGGGSRPH